MNKALLIGYGSIGRRHTEILDKLFNFQVDIITKQNIKNYNCFKSLDIINNLDSYDYYLITSPTHLHYEQLLYLNTHLTNKKIFVEKPIFNTSHSLEIKNFIYVGYNLRYTFVVDKLKKIIGKEKILFIQSYVGQYLPTWRKNIDYKNSYSASKKQGGGVLLDLSHELDYIQYLCGNITEIKSYNEKISNLKIDSDDIFTAVGKIKTGTIFNVTMDYISKQTMRYCIIHLKQKTIYADFIKNLIRVSTVDNMQYTISCQKEIDNYSYYNMHYDILNSNNVNGKICNYDSAISIVKIIENIRRV